MNIRASPASFSDSPISSVPSCSSSNVRLIPFSFPSPAAATFDIRFHLLLKKPTICSIVPILRFVSTTASPSKLFSSKFKHYSFNFDSTSLSNDDNDDDDYSENYMNDGNRDLLVDDNESESVSKSDMISGDGVHIEIKKLGRNSRTIYSMIKVDAPLQTLWNILTDYESLADFIPGLALSQVLQKTDNYARLFQVGQQDLALGLKFNAKGIVDCYEKELQRLPFGKKRDIEFKMIEGDFELFEGKWSIEQFDKGIYQDGDALLGQEVYSTLSYVVDVKPKLWLPVRLLEGRLCKEIKMNLVSIREEAHRAINLQDFA